MTIDEVYKKFVEQLKIIYDQRESSNIADWVFESVTGIKRLNRISEKQQELDNPNNQQLQIILQQLLRHKPVQYILGEAWFYKMKLKVNEHVLIPRPETEELVEWVETEIRNKKLALRNKSLEQITIFDVGTGSGCISIALKKELPYADILAIDVSEDALKLAHQNAADQNTAIQFLQLDFLNESLWKSLKKFDIIISNPPYIPANEKNKLSKNVLNYEPHVALFVTDDDPFIFYKKIAGFAKGHLKNNGKFFVELHEDFAHKVQKLFAEKSFRTEIKKDLFGRERMICGYK